LDPAELGVEGTGKGPDQKGLREPGETFEEHVSPSHERNEEAPDRLILPYDSAVDGFLDPPQ
jgi:hypothetical protein